MAQHEGFNARDRAASFRHAGRGVATMIREQHNARIHLVMTALVVVAGFFFGVSRLEWCALLLATALVWGAEALNTAIEHVADAAVPEQHPLIGKAKDAAAGGVLGCAVGAALVGAIVFGPRVLGWLGLGS